MAATNVETGEYTEWTQDDLTIDEIPNAAVASSSIPGFFPPYRWEGRGVFMDGMTAYNINVEGAVKQCRKLVDDDSKIIIDVLMCNAPDEPEAWDRAAHTTWSNFWRYRDLNGYYHGSDSIASSMSAHPTMQWRYVVKQKNGNSGLKEVNLDGDFTWQQQLNGRQDAQDALNGTNGANVKDYFREWTNAEAANMMRVKHVKAGDYVAERSKMDQSEE